MVGEIPEEVEPPDRDDQPCTRVERAGKPLPHGIGRPGRVGRRVTLRRERPAHQPRSESRMDFERRGEDRKQQVQEKVSVRRPFVGIVLVVIIVTAVFERIPRRPKARGTPRELQRHGEIVAGILVDEDVQPRAEADIVDAVARVVDRKGLQFGTLPAARVDLCPVAQAQFVVERLRDGRHFVLAGIDEGLRRGCPGRGSQQQEKKKFLHRTSVRSGPKIRKSTQGRSGGLILIRGASLFHSVSLSLQTKFHSRMFENLTDKLERSFKILKGEGRITEINVAETLKEIRRALIDADVNYKVAKTFTDEVKQKALGQDVLKAVKPGQMMTKIVRDELAELMGGTATDIRLEGTPAVILIAGLQGSGKTTFSGKLASLLKSKKGRQVLLVAGDVYRPAAIDQLKVLGGQIGVEVYTEEGNRNPVEIAENGIKYARQRNYNVVIVDTAGRLAVDEAMMQEITAIKAAVKPSETLFVVDAMTGQDAVNTAREFNERLDFDGVVLTKLDGDTRGGAAISIRSVVNKPLKFISSGEKMDALQVFHPERMADRILGMGDVVSLVERAQEQFDEEEARKLKKKLVKNQFNFNDFISQIQQIKKMGNLKDLASMLPGMGKMLKNVDIPDDVFKQTEAIISSMTPAEREHPEIINARRRERIAKGSGTTMADVNRLMKQFDDTRKMMKAVAGGGMKMPKMPGGMMRR